MMEREILVSLFTRVCKDNELEAKGRHHEDKEEIPRTKLISALKEHKIDHNSAIREIVNATQHISTGPHRGLFNQLHLDWVKYEKEVLTTREAMLYPITLYNCFDNPYWISWPRVQGQYPSMSTFRPVHPSYLSGSGSSSSSSNSDSRYYSLKRASMLLNTQVADVTPAKYVDTWIEMCKAQIDASICQEALNVSEQMLREVQLVTDRSRKELDERIASFHVPIVDPSSTLEQLITDRHITWKRVLQEEMTAQEVKTDFIDSLISSPVESKSSIIADHSLLLSDRDILKYSKQPLITQAHHILCTYTRSLKEIMSERMDSIEMRKWLITCTRHYNVYSVVEALNWLNEREKSQTEAKRDSEEKLRERKTTLHPSLATLVQAAIDKDLAANVESVWKHLMQVWEQYTEDEKEEKKRKDQTQSLVSRVFMGRRPSGTAAVAGGDHGIVPIKSLLERVRTVVEALPSDVSHPTIDSLNIALHEFHNVLRESVKYNLRPVYEYYRQNPLQSALWPQEIKSALSASQKLISVKESLFNSLSPRWIILIIPDTEIKKLYEYMCTTSSALKRKITTESKTEREGGGGGGGGSDGHIQLKADMRLVDSMPSMVVQGSGYSIQSLRNYIESWIRMFIRVSFH